MSANDNTATAFTSHLVASDKREWFITLGRVRFALVRSEPKAETAWLVDPSKPVEMTSDWALLVLADDGERVQVGRETGMRMNVDATGRRPSIAVLTQRQLTRLMDRARTYVEAHQRLSIMLDIVHSNPVGATKKILKLRESASLALRFHRLVIACDSAFAAVCGEAVLVVNKGIKDQWTELTYRVGDRAVHGSYNVAYIGKITSISPKTITVVDGGTTRRMKHDDFLAYNNRPISVADRRNANWSD